MSRKPTSHPSPISPRWKNPRGLGTLYVRHFPSGESWLYTSVGSRLESTGIRWPETKAQQEKARKDGMDILEKRAQVHVNPALRYQKIDQQPSTLMLRRAIILFEEARYPDVSKHIRWRFQIMFRHYFAGEDIPMVYALVLERLATRNAEMKLAASTKRKVLEKLRIFLDYCVEREWLRKSPFPALGGVQRMAAQDDNRIWEQSEVKDLVEWLENAGERPCALLLRFLYRTGMRIGEACKLRWEDVTDTFIRIDGKTGNYGKKKIRFFPLVDANGTDWIPGLGGVIAELRAYADGNGGYVFPWRAEQVPQRIFKKCREAKGLDDGRALHTLRKSAIWFWREELRLDIETISELAGHAIDVNVRHYRRKRTPEEMARAVTMEGQPAVKKKVVKRTAKAPTKLSTKKAAPTSASKKARALIKLPF